MEEREIFRIKKEKKEKKKIIPSIDLAISKLITSDTSLISIPRPATSVATKMSFDPFLRLARAYSLCS